MIHNPCRFLGLILILTFVLGCGRTAAPPPVDPNAAREGLSAALDAWKRGDAQESLLRQSPSIQFVEPKWDQGFRLSGYKILPKSEWDGRMARLTVQLSLKNKDGAESEAEVAYTVDAQRNKVAIVHSEWDED